MSKLSQFLRQQRDQRGWSLTTLAERSGVPLSTLSRYANPRSRGQPDHDNILLLAAAFEMPPQDVLKYIGYPVRPSANDAEREARWVTQRALLEGDPRAKRILELYDDADDEEKDGALSILETYFSRRRPTRRRS